MHGPYVVAAGVMGTAVVVAAAFAVLVFAGVFDVSPGVGGGHRTETLVKHPSRTTTDPSSPSTTTTTPPSLDTTAQTGPLSPDAAAQTGRSPLPPSNRVASPHTTAGAQVPAPPSLNSSGAPAPALTTVPAGSPTCDSPKESPKDEEVNRRGC
jgi:hypothetical protein